MIVSVFKTSVCNTMDVGFLKPHLDGLSHVKKWNFDLQDADRILRVESKINLTNEVIHQLTTLGFECSELH